MFEEEKVELTLEIICFEASSPTQLTKVEISGREGALNFPLVKAAL